MQQQGSSVSTIDHRPLKRRTDLHMMRKLWHMLGVLSLAGIYHQISQDLALRLISVAAFSFVIFDFFRLQWSVLNQFVLKVLGSIMREYERHHWAGTTHLILGVFILVGLFPRSIVMLTLLFLAVADPLASYFGIRFGRDKLIGAKSLQGTFAAFVICTLIAAIYLYWTGLLVERLLIVSLLAGLSGALSELVPVGKLDDNFSFPVINGAALWILFFIFGGLT